MALDLNLLNKLSTSKKVSILVAFVIIVCAIYYFTVYTNLVSDLQQNEKKKEDLYKKMAELKAVTDRLDSYKEQVEGLERQLQEALQQLPDSKEIDSLLSSVNNKGEESGLDFLLFKPLSEIPKPEFYYAEVPVKILVKGTYLDVATFFYKISTLKRIINVSEIEMSKPVDDNGRIFLETSCVATTFKFLKPSEIPAPPPAPATAPAAKSGQQKP